MAGAEIKRNLKRRMKAVFINNSGVMHMTKGNAYEVIGSMKHIYKIINDDGRQRWHQKYMFMPLEEWRDQQLNEILID